MPQPPHPHRGPFKRWLRHRANRRAAKAQAAQAPALKLFRKNNMDYQQVHVLNGFIKAERRDLRIRLKNLRTESTILRQQIRELRKQKPQTPAIIDALARAQALLAEKTQRIKEDPADLESGLEGLRRYYSGSLVRARGELARLMTERRQSRSRGLTGRLRVLSRKKGSLRRLRAMRRSGALERMFKNADEALAKKWGL